ncbi:MULTISPECIES: hypothetical protein [unclassified Flavobacterium]|jgi:hypothetical protein|uniref:hypothetical protein n=1 Tax=unclassified Flavobacterium TaxID=196869 RepID=UPI0025BDDF92|nr:MULTISPECIES: hypothetical protein [unclassified Flavobacterium]
MLNKGLRDQESIRIDNILRMLHSLVLPKFWDVEDTSLLENILKDLGLNIQSLVDISEKDLITHLLRCHLDWNQLEQFADFLIKSSRDNPFDFSQKAISIYDYIQKESKTFSFEIFNKIAAAKANL